MDATFWLFQFPNFVLAAAMYTLIGRYILSVVFPSDSDRVFWRVIVQVTDPILAAVRFVTPAVVPLPVIMMFAVVWMLILRVALFLALRAAGLTPSVSG